MILSGGYRKCEYALQKNAEKILIEVMVPHRAFYNDRVIIPSMITMYRYLTYTGSLKPSNNTVRGLAQYAVSHPIPQTAFQES